MEGTSNQYNDPSLADAPLEIILQVATESLDVQLALSTIEYVPAANNAMDDAVNKHSSMPHSQDVVIVIY